MLQIIVVSGKRASLAKTLDIKREKIEIVDSIVAEDIGKLPDFSVTDALSRVTGVQILRDRGEGGGVAIRGLTQMETLLNGREVFSAGNGRTLDFADIPSEMVAGIDVYKTAPADQLEGGVGGTIDLRTNRPFDFKGGKLGGSVRYIYGDLRS
jgi:TonB-dependent receptor